MDPNSQQNAIANLLGDVQYRSGMVEASDADLMERLAAGERAALGELYVRHCRRAQVIALRILRSVSDAEEVVHDVFLELWQRSTLFDRSRGSVGSYVSMLARSRALDRVRSLGRARTEYRQEMDMLPAEPERNEPEARMDAARVRIALDALAEPQRAVVELAYFEGLSSSEISERLQVPVGTVKSRTAAAFAALRNELKEAANSAVSVPKNARLLT